MNRTPTTFWEHVYYLRDCNLIDRVWKSAHLSEYIEQPRGQFAATTIVANPYNSSISKEGDKIGDFVKKGQAPKAWRVGRGQFQLIKDPADDGMTQAAQMNLARARAEELRAKKKRPVTAVTLTASTLQGSPSMQHKPAPASADWRAPIAIALAESEHHALAGLSTEQKALAIAQKYLISKYGARAEITEDREGADIRVTIDGKTERIEVKGTVSPTIAWQKLKVSSQQSHDALASGDASIYRVVDVDSANPRIYILNYGEHFTLEPEPRWAVKRVLPNDDRYSLRGKPYRYESPFDTVASDDWEVQQ